MRIIVLTCDLYVHDVLPIFAQAFRHHWPDCPWPVEAVGETEGSEEFPTNLMGLSRYSLETRILAVRQKLLQYLDNCQENALMFFMDDWILYAHPVITPDIERAHEVIIDDDKIGGVLFWGGEQPEKFYDGFLGEYEDARGTLFRRPGIWKPWALEKLLRDSGKPRILGTYYPPIVHADLMGGGKVRASGVKGLEEQRSIVLPMLKPLREKFGEV